MKKKIKAYALVYMESIEKTLPELFYSSAAAESSQEVRDLKKYYGKDYKGKFKIIPCVISY